MVQLHLLNVGIVEQTEAILLVLRAVRDDRLLVIETGPLEGQAILLGAEAIREERPLTHDLLCDIIEGLGAQVKEVQIHTVDEDTFYAKVVLRRSANSMTTLEFDARPSDAIAIALRAGAPILAAEEVLEAAGVSEASERERLSALFEPEGRVIH